MKILYTLVLLLSASLSFGQIYVTHEGMVHFISDAPLEVIEADSDQLQGLLDIDKKIFAFKMHIKSFTGFNSPLQQVHFYENYMEASEYPQATFRGKILEPIKPGETTYRAKGILEIHGESVERIIEVKLTIGADTVRYWSAFLVPLVDHNIRLPQIVYQKIAETIRVRVEGVMQLRE